MSDVSTDTFDRALIQDVANQTQLPLTLMHEVSNRRGAKLLKVIANNKTFGLKFTTSANDAIAHEASILKALPKFTDSMHVAEGNYQSRAWLLMRWLSATPVYQHVQALKRDLDDPKPSLLTLFMAMFTKVADLHALGYVHGDLQPDHFLIAEDGRIRLLDFGLTHKPSSGFNYQGALVHFSPPEVCSQQLEHKEAPEYKEALAYEAISEVYSLASVVFFLYTGHIYPDYGGDGLSLEQKRERIAAGYTHNFVSLGCDRFEALEQIITKCLAIDPYKRYSSVTDALNALQTRL
ncbi:MAG: protein kinase [Deinococcota bacterium]